MPGAKISLRDYMKEKLYREPNKKELLRIATIISWNLWQMDGLTYTIPFQKTKDPNFQLSLFGTEEKQNSYCKVKDWRAQKIILFKDLLNGGEDNEQS